jgi:hypothetical protein
MGPSLNRKRVSRKVSSIEEQLSKEVALRLGMYFLVFLCGEFLMRSFKLNGIRRSR